MTERAGRSANTSRRRILAATVGVALGFVLLARILGPSDLWHQTQPRSIAYTVDMLVHGGTSWLLPLDFAGIPATKPPLYNWLAAPFVAVFGRNAEAAHKAPSILALAAMVVLVVRVGRHLGDGAGWLAALACLASYPFFKLGYLARPDMVLVAVMLGAWWCATRLLLEDPPNRTAWQGGFWLCVVASALAKGPVAVLPLAYVVLAARFLCGRWRAALNVGPLMAVPAAAAVAAYYTAIWRLDARHAYETVWLCEILGRVTGDSPEVMSRDPLRDRLLGPLKMPAYFMLRFLPWSVAAVAGCAVAVQGAELGDRRRRLLLAALIWSVVIVVAFSLAAGKRADYIAPAYPTMALVAAWWILEAAPWSQAWIASVVAAAIAFLTMGTVNLVGIDQEGATISVAESIRARLLDERDGPTRDAAALVVFDPDFVTHLSSMTTSGRPVDSSEAGIDAALDRGDPLRIGYMNEHLSETLRARLEVLRASGRLRERWRVPLHWQQDGRIVQLSFVFVEVAGGR